MNIVHTYQAFEANDAGTERRNAYAQRTRDNTVCALERQSNECVEIPTVVNRPFALTERHRTSRVIGERRACPFIRDVLDEACEATVDGHYPEFVVYSNTDCAVVAGWHEHVARALAQAPCCFSPRVDVERFPDRPLSAEDLAMMPAHVGADLFAFRRSWWIGIRDRFPDMIACFEGWDFAMKCVMLASGFHPAMLQPVVYHERHTSHWTRKLVASPGQIYNRAIGRRWARANGYGSLCCDASESAFAFKPTPEVLPSNIVPGTRKRHSLAIVQLGRFGDIVNILPVAKHYADILGERVAVVAHPDFVSMLYGCSYVHPYAATVKEITEVNAATEAALSIADDVLVTQVYGDNNARRRRDSFCLDSWRLAGIDHLWDELLPEFDLRDPKREANLIIKYSWLDWALRTGRPVVGHCGGGHSSPTGWWSEFIETVGRSIGSEPIWIDLGQVRAEKPYDLLGVMERCSALLLADTMHLHLSAATRTPTVGVVTDQPTRWHGCAPRRHWTGCVRYEDARARPSDAAAMLGDVLDRSVEKAGISSGS